MPCDEGKDAKQIYEAVILENQVRALQGGLCALCEALDRRGIAEELLVEASRNGLIDLMIFWKEHKKTDIARLAQEIHKYSKDEQAIIKDLLNQQ